MGCFPSHDAVNSDGHHDEDTAAATATASTAAITAAHPNHNSSSDVHHSTAAVVASTGTNTNTMATNTELVVPMEATTTTSTSDPTAASPPISTLHVTPPLPHTSSTMTTTNFSSESRITTTMSFTTIPTEGSNTTKLVAVAAATTTTTATTAAATTATNSKKIPSIPNRKNDRLVFPSSDDTMTLHRPPMASAPATTTTTLNKLSPSVAHSSLATPHQQQQHPPIVTTTTSTEGKDVDGPEDHNSNMVQHQSDNTDTIDGTNQTNVLFQKMTVGGEEAIHHLRNIFATPISFAVHAMARGISSSPLSNPLQQQPQQTKNNDDMPYYPKTDYERTFLQKALQNHYLFESQSNTSIQKLIDAFEICTIDLQDPNTVPVHDDHTNTTEYHVPIIHQGEEVIAQPTNTQHPISNAYFYVVYYGTCSFTVDDTMVGFAYPGDAFGELALLYNGPRAATVTAILKEQDDIIKTHQVVMRKDDDNNDDGIDPHAAARLSSNAVSLSTMSDIASISDMELGSNPNAHNNNTDGMMMTDPTGISNDVPPTFPDYTVVLFRVHQRSFRIILQQDDQESNHVTMNLLNNIEFLQNVPLSVRENLAQVLVPVPFNAGDHILPKGTLDCPWYVIERGTVRATNLEHGYQDFCFTEGQCFGERAIMANAPAIADVYAETAGVAFTVDGNTFKALIGNVLGSDTNIISRQQDISRLKGIRILSSATQTDDRVLNYLSKQITDQTFPVGAVICRANEPLVHLPSLYLIRTGTIRLDYVDKVDPIYLGMDAYFGEDQLQADMSGRDRKGLYISPYTATVIEECTCGTLRLRDCRNVIDTRRMGEEGNVLEFDSLSLTREIDKGIQMNQLTVHRMIGAGTFGQVHLVSRTASDGTERVYALKVQSKYELCQSGQAKGVVREKNIMKMFHHPFVAKLLSAFQDEKCVYMVMNLLQGGELYSIMHTKKSNVLPEQSAKFYIACVAEALFYLHCSHSLVFRDLKPENVMIDNDGYAILIDFGFCKKISGKTYTTCGTPLYLAPEVILNRGHSWSVDYWSLGIMIYEMLVGHTPFYEHGMNKAELFQNIVRGKVYPPTNVSPEVLSLLSGLLRRDPAKRLGSLIGNENDIIEHPWFSDIDRDRLFLKELDAPIIPKIKDPFDSSNFSSWKHVDDKRFVRYPALSPDDELIFKDF